jgi:hypothetical protein
VGFPASVELVPLIEICSLPPREGVDTARVLQALTAAVAEAIPCRREAVWATWRTLDVGYAVGDSVERQQPRETHAPVVHVYANRPADAVDRACEAIEAVLTDELSLAPVFVTVQPVFALADSS